MIGFNPSRRRALVAGALGLSSLGSLSGCAVGVDYDHVDDEAPHVLDPRAAAEAIANARWALVLGSGGPRGFVHVGVIKALEELHVRPPLIVGSSVGALVGALWAAGVTGRELDRMAMTLSPLQIVRISVGSNERFSGTALARFINAMIDNRPLEKLPVRMIPVAATKAQRAVVGFGRGDVGVAVQASAAIEGVFTPVRIRGVEYIDSDLVAPVPVRFAKSLGVLRVISVDASAHEEKAPQGAARFRETDVRKRALTTPDTRIAELNLHPEFGYYVSLSEEFRRRAIDAGYAHTMANAAKIQAISSV